MEGFIMIKITYQQKRENLKSKLLNAEDKINQINQTLTEPIDYIDHYQEQDMKVVLEETWLSVIKEKNRFTIMDRVKDLFFNIGASQQSVRHLKKQIKGFNLTERKKLSNLNYINKERINLEDFFSDIEGKALDNQQIEAVLKDEINNLVVAGAGSGKTITIIGKIKYLIEVKNIDPKDILLISFTKKTTKELEERLSQYLDLGLQIFTFHKLGLDIIQHVEQKPPSISEVQTKDMIHMIFFRLLRDTKFNTIFLNFFLNYYKPYKSQFEFENKREYVEYLSTYLPKSLKGELHKSFEEVEVANFLYMNQINYLYEKQYEHYKGRYRPDFYLPDYDLYIEHFGIDRNGNVPPFFKGKDGKSPKETYNEGITWKRILHKKNKTVLIESYSYEKKEGVLTTNLAMKLQKAGVVLRPLNHNSLINHLQKFNKWDIAALLNLISTFIEYMRSNNIELNSIQDKAVSISEESEQARNIAFLNLIVPIHNAYVDELSKRNEIDFSDMINLAAHYVEENLYMNPYKYIIIDEYQDISLSRLRLIQLLREQSRTKLFCVGDDWQSIYRFTGSKVELFSFYDQYVGISELTKIESTYRYNQNIADTTGKFIQKNPSQLRKNVRSKHESTVNSIHLMYSEDPIGFKENFHSIVEGLNTDSTVLLLGRYHSDLNSVLGNKLKKQREKIIFQEREDLTIEFLSIHQSKGLEADYVILLNTQAGTYGFPSEIQDDKVFSLLKEEQEEIYENAEERRLFYVALTRAKDSVWLLVDIYNKSKFIIELEDDLGYQQESTSNKVNICVDCGSIMKKRKSKYGEFYSCSKYPFCDYKINSIRNKNFKPL
jgi:DNA helicase IV